MNITYSLINKKKYWRLAFLLIFTIFPLGLTYSLHLNTLSSVLDNHWQILDLKLLLQDPVNSLLQLHSQPPLLNAIIWGLSLGTNDIYNNFILLNCIAIAVIAMIIFDISRHYLSSNRIALLIAILYTVSPPTLLNISYPFYPVLNSLGFALIVYSFFILKNSSSLSLTMFACAIAYLYLLRSSFTLPSAILLTVIYCYFARKYVPKKTIFLTFLFTFIVILAVPIKNWLMYGFFGTSSWYPTNIGMAFDAKMALGPWPSVADIKKTFPELVCTQSFGLVDTLLTKSNGEPNYNSCLYFAYAKSQIPNIIDSFNLVTYLMNVKGHMGSYFDTPDGYYFLSNRDAIKNYTFVFNIVHLTLFFKWHQIRVACILIIFYLVYIAKKNKDRFLSVILAIFFMHFFTHVLTDGGESRRHVFDIEFIFYIGFSVLAANLREKYQQIQAPNHQIL
jgi:hypothetical protein